MSAQACLAQEKAGRARIVESLRGTIEGLRAAGDVEGRLKAELVSAHEQLASARAALDAAEERASDRRSEARSLREELDSAQAELRRRGTDAELQEHDATLRMSDAQQRQAMCVLCSKYSCPQTKCQIYPVHGFVNGGRACERCEGWFFCGISLSSVACLHAGWSRSWLLRKENALKWRPL